MPDLDAGVLLAALGPNHAEDPVLFVAPDLLPLVAEELLVRDREKGAP